MADQTYPEPTVGVFIFNNEGKLLILRSHKWPDGFTIPGGHVELGERLEQAACREALEETGLEICDLRLLCFQEFVYDPSFWKPRHFIFFDYACRTDMTEVHLNDEAESYFWIEPKKALELNLDHYTRVSVLKYLELNGKGVSHD
jgi:nucleoside triphosphatase